MAYNGPLPQKVKAGTTGRSSNTAYEIMCGGTTSTGNLQQVASLGSSGQVLSSLGSGKLPIWGNPPLFLISSQSVSGVLVVNFTSGITTNFNNYLLLFTNVSQASGTTPLVLRISTNGGSSYLNSGYLSGDLTANYNTSTFANNTVTSGMIVEGQVASGVYRSGAMYIYNLTSGKNYITAQTLANRFTPASTPKFSIMTGSYDTASTTANALQVTTQNGAVNISGTFTLYGIFG
jgi:hypothetical protein